MITLLRLQFLQSPNQAIITMITLLRLRFSQSPNQAIITTITLLRLQFLQSPNQAIITMNTPLRFRSQPTIQIETALCNIYCFCNTELRTATITKIKGLLIQTQLNTFVLFYITKLTLDECKTLTKNSRTISQHSPMHRTTHYLEHEDPGIIKRHKELCIICG